MVIIASQEAIRAVPYDEIGFYDDQTERVADFETLKTVSIGATTTQGHDSPAVLLADADRMLYRAKDAGRNRVIVLPSEA